MIKEFVKKTMPFAVPIWWRLRGRERRFPFRRIYAFGDLHKQLIEEFGGVSGGYFVEAGANNGINASNTAFLEKHCGWTGMLVEAVPHRFVECAANRERATVVHAALVPFGYDRDYVEIKYCDLMSIAPALSQLDSAEHVETGKPFVWGKTQDISGVTFFAPAKTLDTLLEEQGNPTVDLFSLDVEGAELSVLKGIDFQKRTIKNILVEAWDPIPVEKLLGGFGFAMKKQMSYRDYLFSAA